MRTLSHDDGSELVDFAVVASADGSELGRESGRRTLTESESIIMAGTLWVAAMVAPAEAARLAVPLATVASLLIAVGFIGARMKAVVFGVVLLGFVLGARAQAQYQPISPEKVHATAIVMADPEPRGIGWQVQARLDSGQRVELLAFGVDGFSVRQMSIGQRILVTGKSTPASTQWEKGRHIVGSINVENLEIIDGPPWWVAIPESVRNAVLSGADHLPREQQALYTGLVLGDDRFQTLGQRARFRSVGLSHLLAVSGQNVAFLLAIARPGLRFLGYRSRFVITIGLLGLFLIVTRGEPSVMRATTTAGLSAWAAVTGRHRSGLRLLAVAVTLLIAIDPFLVDVVGFQLSVAASAGILLLSPSLNSRIPGPLAWRETVSITTSAQLSVTPLLLYHFGPTSLVAIPANALAGWAAAGVMIVGLTVGTISGFAPSWLGQTLQLPNIAMLWWLDEVASTMARMATPSLGLLEFIALILSLMAMATVGSKKSKTAIAVGYLAAVLILSVPHPPSAPSVLVPGAEYLPSEAGQPSVLVLRDDVSTTVVDELLNLQVTNIDLVVTERGNRRANLIVEGVADVVDIGAVLAPPQHGIRRGKRLTRPSIVTTGFGDVVLDVPRGRNGTGSTSLVIEHTISLE